MPSARSVSPLARRTERGRTGTIGGVAAAVLAAVVASLALAGCSSVFTDPATTAGDGRAVDSAAPDVQSPPTMLPVRDPAFVPGEQRTIAPLVDAQWAQRVADATGIPVRAVKAYAGAVVFVENQNGECRLGWNTLAGIGQMESHHGTIFGNSIGDDGLVTPPIFGIALDGVETHTIPDTDQGTIDGDPQWDRAVGPMQFIPDSWRNWGIDGSGDGVADPHNIDDATLATANYLCRAGGDLSVPENWQAAIAAYNDAPAYLVGVTDAAVRYAAAARAENLG